MARPRRPLASQPKGPELNWEVHTIQRSSAMAVLCTTTSRQQFIPAAGCFFEGRQTVWCVELSLVPDDSNCCHVGAAASYT
jgi:hypothetical protein